MKTTEPSLFQLEKARVEQTGSDNSYKIHYPAWEIEDAEGNVIERFDGGYVPGQWSSEEEAKFILRELKKRCLRKKHKV